MNERTSRWAWWAVSCLAMATAGVGAGCQSAQDESPERAVAAVTPGLVAAYGFDEGSGTTANDASGNGNRGSLVNVTRTSGGKFGGALSFNGSNSRVTIADAASLDLTRMTLEAWIKPTALGGLLLRVAHGHPQRDVR